MFVVWNALWFHDHYSQIDWNRTIIWQLLHFFNAWFVRCRVSRKRFEWSCTINFFPAFDSHLENENCSHRSIRVAHVFPRNGLKRAVRQQSIEPVLMILTHDTSDRTSRGPSVISTHLIPKQKRGMFTDLQCSPRHSRSRRDERLLLRLWFWLDSFDNALSYPLLYVTSQDAEHSDESCGRES